MKWNKKGLIFKPSGEYGWMNSHAQGPIVLVLDDVLRVYFSTRKEAGCACGAMIDLDKNNPKKILKIYDKPILEKGEKGSFEEHGVMPAFAWKEDNKVYLYYSGWSRRYEIPYKNWSGIAVSDDNGLTFKKMFKGPTLGGTKNEIYMAVCVDIIKKEDTYYCYYAMGTGWHEVNGKLESAYEIALATSKDAINWKRNAQPLLPKKLQIEANTNPAVVEINGMYHMWFCYRGVEDFRDGKNAYRIGYAYSKDLINWTRDDSMAGIDVSESGFDSKMTAYPYIVKVNGKVLMFYTGNGFGKEGFGYAELEI